MFGANSFYMKSFIVVAALLYTGICISQPIEPHNYKKYSGACLSSVKFFNPGSFTFEVKASKASGTIFCAFLTDFEVNRSEDYLKHLELGFELIGKQIDSIKCVAVLYGRKYHTKDVALGFDASEKFHTYKIIQESNVVKWMVDGNLVFSLENETAHQLLRPMRLFINFRPAVSHCDYEWGCIRKAALPTSAYLKYFNYAPTEGINVDPAFVFATFPQGSKDKFKRHHAGLWQHSTIDLIKGDKPSYPQKNLIFGRRFLEMQINRDNNL
jgi:hypothetical protein